MIGVASNTEHSVTLPPSDGNPLRQKLCERFNVSVHTGTFECGEIRVPVFYSDDGPGVAAGGTHDVHQEASDTAVAVHVGVN